MAFVCAGSGSRIRVVGAEITPLDAARDQVAPGSLRQITEIGDSFNCLFDVSSREDYVCVFLCRLALE